MANQQVERLLSDVLGGTGIMGSQAKASMRQPMVEDTAPPMQQAMPQQPEKIELSDPNKYLRKDVQVAPEPVEEDDGYLMTFGKGATQGIEGMMGGVGSVVRWGGEVIGSDGIAQAGKDAEQYWRNAAQTGFAAFDGDTFDGTFMENPSFKRAFGIIGQAVPSLLAAYATGGAAAGVLGKAGMAAAKAQKFGAAAGAGGLGLLEGAPQYGEARDAGKGIGEASIYGTAATVGTAVLEFLPINKLMKRAGGDEQISTLTRRLLNNDIAPNDRKILEALTPSYFKSMAKGMAIGAVEEGTQEGVQNSFQNLVALVGYDDTQKITEGLIESIIGGMGSGGIVSGYSGGREAAVERSLKKLYEANKLSEKERAAADAAVEVIKPQLLLEVPRKEGEFRDAVAEPEVMGNEEVIPEGAVPVTEVPVTGQAPEQQQAAVPPVAAESATAAEPVNTVDPANEPPQTVTPTIAKDPAERIDEVRKTEEFIATAQMELENLQNGQQTDETPAEIATVEEQIRLLKEQHATLTEGRSPSGPPIPDQTATAESAIPTDEAAQTVKIPKEIDDLNVALGGQAAREAVTGGFINKQIAEVSDNVRTSMLSGATEEQAIAVEMERDSLGTEAYVKKLAAVRAPANTNNEQAATPNNKPKVEPVDTSFDTLNGPKKIEDLTLKEANDSLEYLREQMRFGMSKEVSNDALKEVGALKEHIASLEAAAEVSSDRKATLKEQAEKLQAKLAEEAERDAADPDAADDPLFARPGARVELNQFGIDLTALRGRFEMAMKKFKGLRNKIVLVENEAMLPAQLVSIINKMGVSGKFEALYWKGKIYVPLSNVSTNYSPIEILIHEGRHYGFHTILGTKEAQAKFNQAIIDQYPDEVAAYAAENGVSPMVAAQEIFVDLVKFGDTSSFMDKMLTKIREGLRKLFPSLHISKAEIRYLLAQADEMMIGSKEEVMFMTKYAAQAASTEPLFLRKEDLTPSMENIQSVADAGYQRILASITNLRGKKLIAMLKMLPMNAKGLWFDKILPGVADFADVTFRQAQLQDKLMSDSAINISTLKTKEQRELMSVLLTLGSYLQIDPRKTMDEQDWVVENGGDLNAAKAEYLNKVGREIKFPPEQLAMVNKHLGRNFDLNGVDLATAVRVAHMLNAKDAVVAKAYSNAVDQMKHIRDLLFQEEIAKIRLLNVGNDANMEAAIAKTERAYKSIRGAYAPLMRFGGYYIDVRRNGITKAVANFEVDTPEKWDKKYEELRAQYAADSDIIITKGRGIPSELREGETTAEALLQAVFANAAKTISDPVQLQAFQDSLSSLWKQVMPNSAFETSAMKRGNIPGFNIEDGIRSYTSYIKSMAGTYANIKYGKNLDLVINRMQAVIDERKTAPNPQQIEDAKKELAILKEIANPTKGDLAKIAEVERYINIKPLTIEQDILDDLKIHRKTQRNDKAGWISQALGKAAVFYYLSSPSIALVQMSQLAILTAPFLASRKGISKTMSAMTSAVKQVMKPNSGFNTEDILNATLTDSFGNSKKTSEYAQEYALIEGENPSHKRELQEKFIEDLGLTPGSKDSKMFTIHMVATKGLIDITASHTALELAGGTETTGWMSKFTYFMRTSESASRKIATIAALETEDGVVSVDSMESISKTVTESLFNYSHVNKPQVLTGNEYIKVLTQFTTFNINLMVYMTRMLHVGAGQGAAKPKLENFGSQAEYDAAIAERRIAQKNLVGIMGMLFMFAGTAGMPLLDTLFSVLDAFGDDDDPEDSRQKFIRFVKEEFGQTSAEIVDRGVFAQLFGADVSQRIGFSSMNMNSNAPEYLHGRAAADRMAGDWLGPSWGIVSGIMQGMSKAADGDVYGGLIAGGPKPLSDVMKSLKTAGLMPGQKEGIRDGRGNRIAAEGTFSEIDTALMFLGFNPMTNAIAKGDNYELSKISSRLAERRSDLIRVFTKTLENQNQEDMQEAMANIQSFNRKNPVAAIKGGDIRTPLRNAVKGDYGLKSRQQTATIRRYGLNVYTPQ